MANPAPDDLLLAEQVAYYRARAPEYDRWWRREGWHDLGAEAAAAWRAELAEVEQALRAFDARGDVLELACATGWWTERLAWTAGTLTCLDASPEMVALNRARLRAAGLPEPRFVLADVFSWKPERAYDVAFFSFWLSHVPDDRLDAFWGRVAAELRPGGRAYLIDSHPAPPSAAWRSAHGARMGPRSGSSTTGARSGSSRCSARRRSSPAGSPGSAGSPTCEPPPPTSSTAPPGRPDHAWNRLGGSLDRMAAYVREVGSSGQRGSLVPSIAAQSPRSLS